MIPILTPMLLLLGIALVCGIVLTLTDKFFGVKDDKRAADIKECLPGANCGACGYTGCDSYAKALSEGSTSATNLCVPGGDKVSYEIAEIIGVEAGDVVEKVAVVSCNGVCGAVERKYEYTGPKSCIAAYLFYNGDKYCTAACLGYGECAAVCPQNAITIDDGVAHIDYTKCIGCGICVRTCPNNIIKLITDTSKVVVKCSNHQKGAVTRKNCTNGCIACMKCETKLI